MVSRFGLVAPGHFVVTVASSSFAAYRSSKTPCIESGVNVMLTDVAVKFSSSITGMSFGFFLKPSGPIESIWRIRPAKPARCCAVGSSWRSNVSVIRSGAAFLLMSRGLLRASGSVVGRRSQSVCRNGSTVGDRAASERHRRDAARDPDGLAETSRHGDDEAIDGSPARDGACEHLLSGRRSRNTGQR